MRARRLAILMWLLLLGLVIRPSPAAALVPPSAPSAPRADLEVALPAVEPDPARARELEESPAWKEFRRQHGEVWQVEWNLLTGTPHRLWGGSLVAGGAAGRVLLTDVPQAEAAAREILRDLQPLVGTRDEDLRLAGAVEVGGRWFVTLQQFHQGIPVEGGLVTLRLTRDGQLALLGSDFYPGVSVNPVPTFDREEALRTARQGVGSDPATDEVRDVELRILPLPARGGLDYRLTYRVRVLSRDPLGLWVSYVDAHSGGILWRYDDLKYDDIYGTVTGDVHDRTPQDAPVARPFRWLTVDVVGEAMDTTDAAGAYRVEVEGSSPRTVNAQLAGSFANVVNMMGPEATFSGAADPGVPLDIHWTGGGLPDSNSSDSERDGYVHTVAAHDSVKNWDPAFTGLDYPMGCYVDESGGSCNAYADGSAIHFFRAGGSCYGMAQVPTVIYHEYGHNRDYRVHEAAGGGGAFSPDTLAEALADYFACTLGDDPRVGLGWKGPGTSVRNIDIPDIVEPPGPLCRSDYYCHSKVLSGACWDMRQNFVSHLPDSVFAIRLADSLFHFAGYGIPRSFGDYFQEILFLDDDDGAFDNGTPHAPDIYDAFNRHGIGGPLFVSLHHHPLRDTEDTLSAREVTVWAGGSVEANPDSILLYYRVNGGAYEPAVRMDPAGVPGLYGLGEYGAGIPAQPAGTTVDYYIYAASETIGVGATDPPGAPVAAYTYHVGPDTIPPLVEHTPLGDQRREEWPPTISATVTDNLGLASVAVEYKRNGWVQPPVELARLGESNVFAGEPACEAAEGDQFVYRVVAVDASTAANTTYHPPTGWHGFWVTGLDTLYVYDAEQGAEGWTHEKLTGSDWDDWHLSARRNHTAGGDSSWWCGSDTTGLYHGGMRAALVSPLLNLGTNSHLSFWHWMQAESLGATEGVDGGVVEISVDGGSTWELLTPLDGYNKVAHSCAYCAFPEGHPVFSGSFDWTRGEVSLAPYVGPAQVRFRFGTNRLVGAEGWYVDDIQLDGLSAPPTGVDGPLADAAASAPRLGLPIPNPFNPLTRLDLRLGAPGRTTLRIYDAQGRLVRTLLNEIVAAGQYSVSWNGTDDGGREVSAGIYFARLEAPGLTEVRKLVLAK